ncbi:hypothetical protein HYPDE_39588 [Hyphomicrobium denitrificans 1NES1]|uniref:Uncharacterized protein n=1 Tax=Hyphomicrobium denitrificans 1NES1 TaxID=670307 RepID=N0BGN8_9HYPH|nr:hypothetical protein HYPDE_39588 [Hyphomicrobium denitrificans 1NES1]
MDRDVSLSLFQRNQRRGRRGLKISNMARIVKQKHSSIKWPGRLDSISATATSAYARKSKKFHIRSLHLALGSSQSTSRKELITGGRNDAEMVVATNFSDVY